MDRQELKNEAKSIWLADYDTGDDEGKRRLTVYLLDYVIDSFSNEMLVDWITLMRSGRLEKLENE